MQLLAWLLAPFSMIYYLITRFRNHLFDIEYKRSFEFEVPIISVGNLSVGGTGKTPMVEYLVRLLSEGSKVVTLSRGYGRNTKGFRWAGENENALSIGDEPFQLYLKYKNKIKVAVGEERALAIPEILFKYPNTSAIILDDAFQHRSVRPQLNIVLTTYEKPFYDDWVLPSGRLREPRKGAYRADIIVVTKCPNDLNDSIKQVMTEKIKVYAGEKCVVLFSAIKYSAPKPVWHSDKLITQSSVVFFSGIADSTAIKSHLIKNLSLAHEITYPDHHRYTNGDIKAIINAFEEITTYPKAIITTEKDMVKLLSNDYAAMFEGIPVFYLPIESYFLKNGHIFDAMVKDKIILQD